MTYEELRDATADAVLNDLEDRRGFRHLMDEIDAVTMNEIRIAIGDAALAAIRAAGVRLMPEEASNAVAMAGLIAQGDAPKARDLGVSAMKAAYTAMRDAGEIKPEGGE